MKFRDFIDCFSRALFYIALGNLLGYVLGSKEVGWAIIILSIANLLFFLLPERD